MKKLTVVYLPTSFVGMYRLGTLREHNDLVHWEQQKKILKLMSSFVSSDVDIVFKVHPKGTVLGLYDFQIKHVTDLGIRIVKEPLMSYVNTLRDSCVLVSDYFGSGFYDCMAENFPMIFLDFHIREFFDAAFADIQRRTTVVSCSIDSDEWLFEFQNVLKDHLQRLKQ